MGTEQYMREKSAGGARMDQSRAAVKARMADAQPIRSPRQGERPGANTE